MIGINVIGGGQDATYAFYNSMSDFYATWSRMHDVKLLVAFPIRLHELEGRGNKPKK